MHFRTDKSSKCDQFGKYVVLDIDLLAFMAFYCNILIDSSFRSYSHFLQVLICVGAFLIVFLREGEAEGSKSHSD